MLGDEAHRTRASHNSVASAFPHTFPVKVGLKRAHACHFCLQRSNRVYKYNLDPCAPTHILIGDGGNIEGTQTQTIDQAYSTTAACLKPPSTAPPFCATFQVRAPSRLWHFPVLS